MRYWVLFVMDLKTRRVEIAGIVNDSHLCGDWMKQVARNLTDPFDGFLLDTKYIILDRSTLYTEDFRRFLKENGIGIVRLPVKSPNLNAFAERFVLSIKGECLDKVIPLGENHLRKLVNEYVHHYHNERNHQGLDNELITPQNGNIDLKSKVKRRQRLGGLLNFYYRDVS